MNQGIWVNPAMMIVALIIALSTISATGYMMGMDRYWGEEWVDASCRCCQYNPAAAVLHLGGVVYAQKHREGKSMMTGWKAKLERLIDPCMFCLYQEHGRVPLVGSKEHVLR